MKLIFLLLTLFFCSLGFSKPPEIHFSKRPILVGSAKITVEIADTEQKTQRGLMYRTSLEKDSGMLFIFQDEEIRSFWMKNTFIPLEIGYFNKARRLIDIQEMAPVKSEIEVPKSYQSRGPAQYALEVNPGWFKRKNVKLGDILNLNPDERSGKNSK